MATGTSVKFNASHHAAVVLLGLGAILVLPLARVPLLKLYWQRATSVLPSCVSHSLFQLNRAVKFNASHHAAVVLLGLGAILVLPLARMPGYAGTLSLVHFAKQESVDPSYQQAICKSPKPVSVYF